MASGQLSRDEALACSGCRHACHVMLYSDTQSQLFGRIPIKHIVLMQMRFDGLLGFPGGLVNPAEESLEAGLGRELLEELGVDVNVSVGDHVESCHAPADPRLITHFYVKKLQEEHIGEVERAAASTAIDHGQEVLGLVRVPLYSLKADGRGGLGSFLSHSFIGNARSQLLGSLLRLQLVAPGRLHAALTHALATHAHTGEDLRVALALTEAKGNNSS